MKSMTGYGKAKGSFGEKNDLEIEVEIKSVNNKNFDFKLNTSLEIQSKSYNITYPVEKEIRDIVNSYLKRGKIDLKISFTDNRKTDFSVNKDKLLSFYKMLNEIKDTLQINQEINLEMIIRSVFTKVSNDAGIDFITSDDDVEKRLIYSFDNPSFKVWVLELLTSAIINHQVLALAEGKNLKDYFIHSFNRIMTNLDLIKATIPEYKNQLYNTLKLNIVNLLNEDINTDIEKRIMLEVAMYLDRCDITEEIVRLESHLQNSKKYIDADDNESVGKSLNFILQEMQREANTISAKYNTSNTFESILIIKEEIERCREQVQNVE